MANTEKPNYAQSANENCERTAEGQKFQNHIITYRNLNVCVCVCVCVCMCVCVRVCACTMAFSITTQQIKLKGYTQNERQLIIMTLDIC